MSKIVKLKKGFDINLQGKANDTVVTDVKTEFFALKPTDFIGFVKPKLLVKEGDNVKAGQPLYYDKSLEDVKFVSPVSGEVVEIRRGEKRRLLEIVVKSNNQNESVEHKQHSVSDVANLSAEDVKSHMAASGVWPNVVQRPFATMANPADTPKAIHISGFDSSPLAPDYNITLKGREDDFQFGIEVLKRLTKGGIHLNVSGDKELPRVYSKPKGIQVNKIYGAHPAGNVGVQIHNIDPVNKGEVVWTVTPYAVAQIGRLFSTGKYDASKTISLVGSEVKTPQYYETFAGAKISDFIANNISTEENVRLIDGNVLTGQKISDNGYLGFYSNQFTAIPEGDDYIFFGSFVPSKERLSFQRTVGLLSFLNPKSKEYRLSANVQGEHRAFVQSGIFEQLVPMDILPVQLLKSILVEDYEAMEALGIYEVAEEDFALCEFADVSKQDIQAMIRKGLDLMQNG